MNEPIVLALHHDVLCGFSYLADLRLSRVCAALGPVVRLERRPFPACCWSERALDLRERRVLARTLRRVAKEHETRAVIPDLWISDDAPRSSLPPLLALEAAGAVGGPAGRDELLLGMRRAALHAGVNVARDDVLLELASTCGLELPRFLAAYRSAATRRLVEEQAATAMRGGVRSVPAVVIGDEWLLSGVRGEDEYQHIVRRFLEERRVGLLGRVLH